MSKLTDEQRQMKWREGNIRYTEAKILAATEPLLQRIAELEETNAQLREQNTEVDKACAELERQLEEARNHALEEAANAVDAMKAPDGYGIQEQSLYDVATMEAADVVRALKGAK